MILCYNSPNWNHNQLIGFNRFGQKMEIEKNPNASQSDHAIRVSSFINGQRPTNIKITVKIKPKTRSEPSLIYLLRLKVSCGLNCVPTYEILVQIRSS